MKQAPTPARSSLLGLAWPLMLSFTLRSILTSIDIPFAARLPDGDAAVAAIGLVFPLEFCFIACWVGLSAALTSYLSRAMGERSEARLEQLGRIAGRMVVLLSLLFLLLAGLVVLLAPHLPLEDPRVAANLATYGGLVLLGVALVGFWSVLPDSLVKAHHDTKTTMAAGLTSGVTNLALNALFVLGLDWGIAGIALATGLARAGGLVVALVRVRTLERQRRASWAEEGPSEPRPVRGPAAAVGPDGLYEAPSRALLTLAVPSSLTFVLLAAESVLVNGILARLPHSTASLAAYAIYHRAVLLFLMPVVGIGVAVLPFVARLRGEGRIDDVARGLREGFLVSYAYALTLAAPTCVLGAEAIARFLARGQEAVELAAFAIRWATPLGVLAGIPFLLCRPAFEAVQRGTPGLVMAALRYLVLSAPLALAGAALASRQGAPPFLGLVLGLVLGSGLSSAVFTAWLVRLVAALRREEP